MSAWFRVLVIASIPLIIVSRILAIVLLREHPQRRHTSWRYAGGALLLLGLAVAAASDHQVKAAWIFLVASIGIRLGWTIYLATQIYRGQRTRDRIDPEVKRRLEKFLNSPTPPSP